MSKSIHSRISEAMKRQSTGSSKKEIRRLLKRKVAKETRRKYRGFYRRLKQTFSEEFGSPRVSRSRFRRWLTAAFDAKIGADTPESYRCAILFRQRIKGRTQWASDEDIMSACAIHRARGRARAKPTGTLTRKMHKKLIRRVKKKNPMAAMCMTLHTLVGGRISQILRIRHGDFQPDDFGKAVIKLRTDKRRRRNGRGRTSKHHDKVVPDEARKLAKKIAKELNLEHGDRLFPSLSKKRGGRIVGDLIKKAAKKLKFPEGYRYVGSHVLRHCGTAMLLEQAEIFMKDLSSQMSARMQRHYGNPLGARRARR